MSFIVSSYGLPLEKACEERQALGRSFLRRRMAAVGELDDLGLLENLPPAREVAGEGRVLHPPDQDRRDPGDPIAPPPEVVVPGARAQQLARVDPGRVAVERLQVVALDLAHVATTIGDGVSQHHAHRESAALVEVAPEPPAEEPGEELDVPVAGE